MSDENTQNTDPNQEGGAPAGDGENDGLKRALADMHKFKSQARELSQRVAEFEAAQAAAEESKLKEKNEYEKLFEAEKEKRERLEQSLNALTLQQQNNVKMKAFVELAGHLAHEDYVNMVDLAKIELDDDGRPVKESVEAYANQFRQNYPHLLSESKSTKMPSKAPPSDRVAVHSANGNKGSTGFAAVAERNGGTLFKPVGRDVQQFGGK